MTLQAILDSHDDAEYPADFTAAYIPMECLSDRNGICTFLVRDKEAVSISRNAMTSLSGRSRTIADNAGLPGPACGSGFCGGDGDYDRREPVLRYHALGDGTDLCKYGPGIFDRGGSMTAL